MQGIYNFKMGYNSCS